MLGRSYGDSGCHGEPRPSEAIGIGSEGFSQFPGPRYTGFWEPNYAVRMSPICRPRSLLAPRPNGRWVRGRASTKRSSSRRVAELDRTRIAAVFAADADFDIGARSAA